jgi:NitT/TauT family transport system ATP-binding protein
MRASARDFLNIAAVDKTYPTREGAITALKSVSFSIGAAEFVSLLGPSGCGKSTLLRCIAGLEECTGGQITVDGTIINGPGPPDNMGIVYQRDVLLDWLTVLRNVLLPCRIRRLPSDEWTRKARALLEFLAFDAAASNIGGRMR